MTIVICGNCGEPFEFKDGCRCERPTRPKKFTKRSSGGKPTRLQELLDEAPEFECIACGTKWFAFGRHKDVECMIPSDNPCADGCGQIPLGKRVRIPEGERIRRIPEGERINRALDQWQLETFGPTRRSDSAIEESP